MYNRIAILALLFLSCREDNEPRDLWRMTLSDAQPVQFWLSECSTYNQYEAHGVFHKCFCQPFDCDDEIVIQFTDNTPSGNTEAITLPALNLWDTTTDDPADPDWTLSSAPEVTLDANETSEILYTDYNFVEDRDYTVTVDYTKVYNSGSSNPRTIRILIMDSLFNILYQDNTSTPVSPGGSDSFTISFTAPADAEKVGIVFSDGSNVTLTVDAVSGTMSISDDFILSVRDESGAEILQLPFDVFDNGAAFVFSLSLIPSEVSPEICNEMVKFVIRNDTTGTDKAQSDCIDIRTHDTSILITYTNHRNFAGLVYEDQSPEISFNLRVPAVFFHQRFPEEDEVMELSSSLATLNSTLRKQRLLDTDYVPYYFHEKLKLVLQHQFVTIFNKEWVKQDAYEIADGNRLWPLKKAKCWISEKDFVQRNVL